MQRELTSEQKKIVETSGDLLIIAGPGSGKTKTLFFKTKKLLEEGVPPEKILILTFGVKVCLELKKKLQEFGLPQLKVDTFHGLAYDFLRDNLGRKPEILSEEEQKKILKKLFPGIKNPLSQPNYREIYFSWLAKENLYDFSFLIHQAAKLKTLSYQDHFLIIDEFQDLSQELFPLLTKLREATWILFGDPNQAIYSFRGTNLKQLKNFLEKHKPGIKCLHLSHSFRCPAKILQLAETFKSSPWEVPSLQGIEAPCEIKGYVATDELQEKNTLLKLIKTCLGGLGLEETNFPQIAPEEIFILSRVKQILEQTKRFLLEEGIPLSLPEERALNFLEILTPWLNSSRINFLPVEEAIKELPSEMQIFLKNLYELWGKDKEKFRQQLQNLKKEDLIFPSTQGVQLLTVHASKGLEARVVILVGAEDGLFPLTIFKDCDLEEEKRLCYVALTRSKEKFYVMACMDRKIFGRTLTEVSPFFKNFPLNYLKKSSPKPKQKDLFS